MVKRMQREAIGVKAQAQKAHARYGGRGWAVAEISVWGWLNYHAVPGNSLSLGQVSETRWPASVGVLRRRQVFFQKFRRRTVAIWPPRLIATGSLPPTGMPPYPQTEPGCVPSP